MILLLLMLTHSSCINACSSFSDSTYHCVKVGLANNDVILGSAEASSYRLPSDRDIALLIGWSLAYLDQPSLLSSQNPSSAWQHHGYTLDYLVTRVNQ